MKPKLRALLRFGVVVISTFVVAQIAAVAYLASNGWFGWRDLRPYAFWTFGFAVYVALATPLITGISRGRRRAVGVSLVTGVLLGLLWTTSVRIVLGPWILAFSFPVNYFWFLGGFAGCLLATTVLRAQSAQDPSASFASPGRRRLKTVIATLAILAVPLWLYLAWLGLAFFPFARTDPETRIVLIPDRFQGYSYILYNVPDAPPPQYENGTEVLEIGSDGVCRTRSSPGGLFEWYSVLPGGERRRMTTLVQPTVSDTPENRVDATPIAFRIGGYWGHSGLNAPCSVEYTLHYVGTRAQFLEHPPEEFLSDYLESAPVPCKD